MRSLRQPWRRWLPLAWVLAAACLLSGLLPLSNTLWAKTLGVTLIAHTGEGTATPQPQSGAGLSVSPLSLDFGPVPVGTLSAPQVVTLRNTGSITLTNFAGGEVSPPFSASQNCASGVPPGGSCQYTFHFMPSAVGRYTTTSNSSTTGGSFTIQLQGGENLLVYLPIVMR